MTSSPPAGSAAGAPQPTADPASTCAVCGNAVRESSISDRLVHVVYPWNLLPPKPWHRVVIAAPPAEGGDTGEGSPVAAGGTGVDNATPPEGPQP